MSIGKEATIYYSMKIVVCLFIIFTLGNFAKAEQPTEFMVDFPELKCSDRELFFVREGIVCIVIGQQLEIQEVLYGEGIFTSLNLPLPEANVLMENINTIKSPGDRYFVLGGNGSQFTVIDRASYEVSTINPLEPLLRLIPSDSDAMALALTLEGRVILSDITGKNYGELNLLVVAGDINYNLATNSKPKVLSPDGDKGIFILFGESGLDTAIVEVTGLVSRNYEYKVLYHEVPEDTEEIQEIEIVGNLVYSDDLNNIQAAFFVKKYGSINGTKYKKFVYNGKLNELDPSYYGMFSISPTGLFSNYLEEILPNKFTLRKLFWNGDFIEIPASLNKPVGAFQVEEEIFIFNDSSTNTGLYRLSSPTIFHSNGVTNDEVGFGYGVGSGSMSLSLVFLTFLFTFQLFRRK